MIVCWLLVSMQSLTQTHTHSHTCRMSIGRITWWPLHCNFAWPSQILSKSWNYIRDRRSENIQILPLLKNGAKIWWSLKKTWLSSENGLNYQISIFSVFFRLVTVKQICSRDTFDRELLLGKFDSLWRVAERNCHWLSKTT